MYQCPRSDKYLSFGSGNSLHFFYQRGSVLFLEPVSQFWGIYRQLAFHFFLKKIEKLIFDQLAFVLSAHGLPEAVLDTAWSC